MSKEKNMKRNINFVKRVLILLIATVVMLPMVAGAKSLYYYEPFTNVTAASNNGWSWDFRMSRDMMVEEVWGTGNTYPSAPGAVDINFERLEIYGRPNDNDLSWNNWYIGDGAKWSPADCAALGSNSITATAERPFGYTIIRYTNSVDPNIDVHGDAAYHKSLATVWMAQDNGASQLLDRWDDFVFFFDKQHGPDLFNNFGYFQEYEHVLSFTADLNSDIDSIDPGNLENFFEKDYDDEGGGDNTTAAHFAGGSGYHDPVVDEMGIKITHNGSIVSIYINPDPLDNTGALENTWVKVADAPVGWYDDIVAFFGIESPFYLGGHTESQYDNFMVRTIASNTIASITPLKALAGATVDFTATVSPQNVETDDSGVGEIYIKKPAGYGAWVLTTVSVTHPDEDALNRQTSVPISDGDFYVKTAGASSEYLHIRFYMNTGAANNIATNGNITISFSLATPATPNSDGSDFGVYVDCSKHADSGRGWLDVNTTGIKYATTGKMKASPVNSGELTVKTYSQPQAYAKLEYSPSPLTIGNEQANFTVKVSTEGIVNAPDIGRVRIQIPSGFTVSNNTPGDTVNLQIKSSVLGAAVSSTNAFVSGGYIYVNYTNIGGLAGVNGFDKIEFYEYGTPTGFSGLYTNYLWQVAVDSDGVVEGTSWSNAMTNSVYNSQEARVTVSNAMILAYIYPEKTAVFADVVSNVNTFKFTVDNIGPVGNNVTNIKIIIPGDFTNISGISSSNGGTWSNAGSYIWLSYAGLLDSGEKDVITFTAIHSNTNTFMSPRSVDFECYANNANSAGLAKMSEDLPRTWSVVITPPTPQGEHKFEPAVIYTTAITNIITNTIYNTAPKGVSAKLAKIEFMTNRFPTIVSATSVHLGSQANLVITNIGETNIIYVKYGDDGSNLLSVYDNATEKDQVIITVVDSISYDTFAQMPTNISIPTYLYKTSYETNDTNSYKLLTIGIKYTGTNKLWVEHPPIDIEFYISPEQIDTTSVTNTVTFFITNKGEAGNRIHNVYIPIPADVSTNVVNFSSTYGAFPLYNSSLDRVEIPYLTPLDGGSSDTVTFEMRDIVDGEDKQVFFNPTVQNDRETKVGIATVVSGKSASIDFVLPKPSGGGWASPNVFYVTVNEPTGTVITQSFTVRVTNEGVGTDRFDRVCVEIPLPLQGQIARVDSSRMGVSSASSPSIVQLSSTNLIVVYTNGGNEVLINESDMLTFLAYVSNVDSLPTNGTWKFYADNGFTEMGEQFFNLTNSIPGSKLAYGTERVNVSKSGLSLTTDKTNTFTYSIENGTNGSRSIKQVRVTIPWPYSVIVSSVVVTETFATVSTNDGYMYLTYAGGAELDALEKTIVEFNAIKPIVAPTNVDWPTEIYYVDNYESLWYGNVRGSATNAIKLPSPVVKVGVGPNIIGKDALYGQFWVTVTNGGEEGNNIYTVKIVPPYTNTTTDIITNINSISSTLLSSKSWYSNNGILYLEYTNFTYGQVDTIGFAAYDNQDEEGFIGNWGVFVANYPGIEPTISVSEMPGSNKSYQVVTPAYNSSYYVLPNNLSTVEDSNTINIYVNNIGSGTNNIDGVRVYIDYPFMTNGAIVSSSIGGTASLGAGYIQVEYTSGLFIPFTNDTISLILQDELIDGSTNTFVTMKTKYNTSSEMYKEPVLGAGTNEIQFAMPDPDVSCEILPNDIYTSERIAQLKFRFINKGKGSNKAEKIKLYIPEDYTNGLLVGSLTDTLATNTMLSNGNIYVMLYNSFTPGVTNDITLNITNTQTNKGSFDFESDVFNGLNLANTSTVASDSKTLEVVSAPSAEIMETSREVYSANFSNEVNMKINNNTSGDSLVYYARIIPPAIYTNIASALSTYGTISNEGTNLVVYYPSGLAKGMEDTLLLIVLDSVNMYETNGLEWVVKVNNSTGYGISRELYGNALKHNMVIPLPSVTNNILTSWFMIQTGINPATNTFKMMLSNTGVDANSVFSNKITIPTALSTILDDTITMSYSGAKISNIGGVLVIEYTNTSKFYPGETNLIEFQFTNVVKTPLQAPITMYAYNGSSLGDTNTTMSVEFRSPSEPTETYVYGKKIIYSIDHSADIVYNVVNGMYDVGIDKLRVKFETTGLSITNIYSEKFSTNIPYISTPSNIVILYENLGSLPSKLDGGSDMLHFYVVYTNTASWTNDMSADVMYEGTIDYVSAKKPSGENDFLPVLLADFGRIIGYALPGSSSPTIKLYYVNTTILVTNKFTELITGSGDSTGYFMLDFVPPGLYDVSLSGKNYRENIIEDISVSENIIKDMGSHKMKRSTFDPNAEGVQASLCLDDMLTELIVPAGVIDDYFSVDIWLTNMTEAQQNQASGGVIQTPKYPANVVLYWFDIGDQQNEAQSEQEVKGNLIIKLHYEESNLAAQGWSEDSLAIYYWREMTGEWVRIGGKVDKDNNMVIAKVAYLHKHYIIFGENALTEIVPGFVSVNVDPKVFTPRASDRMFKNIKISFGFVQEEISYEVKIYDLYGTLVRKFEHKGTEGDGFTQGEVYWDGNDEENYPVKSGVYIYRIITVNGQVYSGTIVIAR